MTNILLQILEITVTMSVVIALLLLFSRFFGKRFTAKCRYIVWTVVIIRMCFPVGFQVFSPVLEIEIPSEISRDQVTVEKKIKDKEGEIQGASISDSAIEDGVSHSEIRESSQSVSGNGYVDEVKANTGNTPGGVTNVRQGEEKEAFDEPSYFKIEDVSFLVFAAWLMGAAVFMGTRLVPYAVYLLSRKKNGILHSPDEKTEEIYKSLCEKLGVKRAPCLLVSRAPVTPHVSGYFRRKIIIPDMRYATSDVEGILAHELTHCKRGDIWVKLMCALARSLNWFNPLTHIAAERCVSEMELSCDESVLKNSNEEERVLYGKAMLNIARRCGHIKGSYLTSGFKPKHGAVKERIMNIIDGEKKKKGRVVIAAALVISITASAIIGCSIPAKKDETKPDDKTNTVESTTDVPDTAKTPDTNDSDDGAKPVSGPVEADPVTQNPPEHVDVIAKPNDLEIELAGYEKIHVKYEKGVWYNTDIDEIIVEQFKNTGYYPKTVAVVFDNVKNFALIEEVNWDYHINSDELNAYAVAQKAYAYGHLKDLVFHENAHERFINVVCTHDMIAIGASNYTGSYYVFYDGGCDYLEQNVDMGKKTQTKIGYDLYEQDGKMAYRKANIKFNMVNQSYLSLAELYTSSDEFMEECGYIVIKNKKLELIQEEIYNVGEWYNKKYRFKLKNSGVCDLETIDEFIEWANKELEIGRKSA